MEKIQAPKKERKFLKAVGNIAKVLANELVMGIARKFIGKAIDKVGNKRQGLTIASVILASTFAFAQYPATGNKQRLGFQTSGDGLVYRGRAADTVGIKSSGLNNAYFILDTVNNVVYNYIKTKGGWLFNNSDTIIVNNNFTQPLDSLFFKTSIPTNNVDTAKMRWDSDLGTVVLGMYDKVPNELGFKNFWLVKNQTGSTITKGSIVYANGTVGASGRITVAKFIANGSIDAKYLLGITAHDLTDGEDGYVISFGKIRQVNTDTFAAGAILYPSPTTAGVWTDVEPVAPNIDMPIGFCINSSSNNGTIAIKVESGYKLHELHDIAISSPVENSSLYYKGGLWRDTTSALLGSDTASMLTNYLRTGIAASTYLTQSNAASTYLPLTGGTLTGLLRNTSQRLTGNITISDFNSTYSSVQIAPSSSATVNLAIQQNISGAANISMGGNQGGGGEFFNPNIYFTDNRKAYASIGGIHTSSGTNNQSGHIVFTTTPSLNTIALTERMRIAQDGAITMGGTLGVTGATTLSSTLAVTGNITEGGNNVLTNLDTVSLSSRINNRVSLTGNETIAGVKTFADQVNMSGQITISGSVSGSNRLLGKNTSNNGIGDVTLGTGLTLSPSNVLDATVLDTSTMLSPYWRSGKFSGTLPIVNGGTGATNILSARTNLGGTTIGQSMFTLTNPSAVTFPRFNADNTISALNATDFRAAIGAGTGNGTVTAVGGSGAISSSGGTTPIISVASATGGSAGVVTSTTQVFGGDKTFNGIVGFSSNIQRPIMTITENTSILTSNCWIIVNNSSGTTTLTLPVASLATGSELYIKTAQPQAVISASSNVVPLTFANTASTNILPATDGAWCTLVSNGTFWVIMASN
jgi:hypothetical protein